MKQNGELYDSSAVWDQIMQAGQRNLVRAIVDFFPTGICTALDVGCGDGKITRSIMKETGGTFTGLDSSEEALKRCGFTTVLGDAASLPFPDAKFDLVMSTDTLEHLPDEAEGRAWNELFRVADSWVAIAVPFRENLQDARARCPSCGRFYHVNWHVRSYDWRDLVSRVPENWIAENIVLSGEAWSPVHPLETEFRRNLLDEWSGWDSSVCPSCGRRGSKPDEPREFSTLVAGALGGVIYSRLRSFPEHRVNSEVLAFFRKAGRTASFSNIPRSTPLIECSLGEVLFSFPFEKDLEPYPQTARVVEATDGGIIVQFPVYGQNDILELVPERTSSEPLKIVVEDALGVVLSESVQTGTHGKIEIPLPRKVVPGYFGLLLRLPARHSLTSACFGGKHERRLLADASRGESSYFLLCGNTPCPIYVHVHRPMSIVQSSIIRRERASSTSWRALFEGIESLEKERDEEKRYLKNELGAFSVHLQNLRAEREALLERAKEADARAVEVQNLRAEREALLERAKEADARAVEVQNLRAEREALLERAKEADACAVEVQNLRAEREALLERAKEADACAVEVQNLRAEREALQPRLKDVFDYGIRAFWRKTGGGKKS